MVVHTCENWCRVNSRHHTKRLIENAAQKIIEKYELDSLQLHWNVSGGRDRESALFSWINLSGDETGNISFPVCHTKK